MTVDMGEASLGLGILTGGVSVTVVWLCRLPSVGAQEGQPEPEPEQVVRELTTRGSCQSHFLMEECARPPTRAPRRDLQVLGNVPASGGQRLADPCAAQPGAWPLPGGSGAVGLALTELACLSTPCLVSLRGMVNSAAAVTSSPGLAAWRGLCLACPEEQ